MATYKLTIQSGKVTGTHTDFPVLIMPTTITGLPTLTTAEADSLRFYSDAALSTELAREVVGVNQIWVKVPSLSSSTEIYMDYDGARSDYAAGDTYGRNAVWTTYQYVVHHENATDATGNYTLSNAGVSYTGSAKVGSGNSGVYGGTFQDDRVATTVTGPNLTANDWTVSAWVYMFSLEDYAGIFCEVATGRGFSGSTQSVILVAHNDGTILANPGGYWVASSNASLGINTWYKMTWTYNNTSNTVSFRINGVDRGSAGSFVPNAPTGPIYTGSWQGVTNNYRLNGLIDHCSLQLNEVSDDWDNAEYENQNDNNAFWSAEEFVGSSGLMNFMMD